MHTRGFPALLLPLLVLVAAGCRSVPEARVVGPWDLAHLGTAPTATWGSRTGLVQEVYYEGEPLGGRPTRVFGYLARPAGALDPKTPGKPAERFPAMVLVHGGGGKAFAGWAEFWARRGIVALAMDLSGNGPSGRLPDGGPDQADTVKFRPFREDEAREMWSYHAVAAVIRGHSLVRSLPEVDPDRVGLTGISWGGYLTCMVAGVDDRFRVAVPVYGCGFLGDNSVWKDGSLAGMPAEDRARWLRLFDPGVYLSRVRCPILFLNGTSDFAYPLDSYQKSYRQVPEKYRHLSVVIDLPHGHIWTFREVDTFVDSVLKQEKPLADVGATKVDGATASAPVRSALPLASASLCFTTDEGPWSKRHWTNCPARLEAGRVVAELPAEGRVLTAYLAVVDQRGLRTSGEHFQVTR